MKWRKILRYFVGLGCVALVAFAIISWYVGGQLLAPAPRTVGEPPEDLPVVVTTLESESGSSVATWYIPTDNAHATVVLLHGIRGNRRDMLQRARLLYEAGYSTVTIDFQAHGESPGENITVGFLEKHDVRAAVAFARKMNPNHRIGIVGYSLGGAAALLASPLEIDAAVLEAVYPTLDEAVNNRIAMRLGSLSHVLTPVLTWQLPLRLGISSSELRPIDHIAQLDCPVLVAGGDIDKHTPLEETRRLFDSAAWPKKLVIFQDTHHTDFLKHDREKYKREVLSFLEVHLAP